MLCGLKIGANAGEGERWGQHCFLVNSGAGLAGSVGLPHTTHLGYHERLLETALCCNVCTWGRRKPEELYLSLLFSSQCFVFMCLIFSAWHKNSKSLPAGDVRHFLCYLCAIWNIFFKWNNAAVFNWYSVKVGGTPLLLCIFGSANCRKPLQFQGAAHSSFILLQVSGEGWWMRTALWTSQCNTSALRKLMPLFIKALGGSCWQEVWEPAYLSFQVVIAAFLHPSADCTGTSNRF